MSDGGTNIAETAMTLQEFLATAGTLTAAERMAIARQALVVLEQNYAHLPLKQARYAVNPLQRLRLLIARLSRSTMLEPEWRFHAEMLDIFGAVRDLHTRYVLPEPFANAFASLPFRIKDFVEDGTRHFVVAPLSDGTSGTLPAGPRWSPGTVCPSSGRSTSSVIGSPGRTRPPGGPERSAR
jgi:hypothetical protein